MSNWKPQKGDRITWRGKPGVVTDNYWADRDRFTIRLDDGSESDHGAESLRPEVREAQHSPRAILAKAYRDNGDIGAANYIEGGYDLLPDTQVHLLAIQDALAVPYTPKPPAGDDAGAVERAYRQGQIDMRDRAAAVCDERGAEEQESYGLNRAAQNYFRARNAVRDLEPAALALPAPVVEGERWQAAGHINDATTQFATRASQHPNAAREELDRRSGAVRAGQDEARQSYIRDVGQALRSSDISVAAAAFDAGYLAALSEGRSHG